MGTINTSLVDAQIRAFCRLGKQVARKVREALESIEENPEEAFPKMDSYPRLDLGDGSIVTFHKVKIIQGKHNLRILYACRSFDDGAKQHADLFRAFLRADGYKDGEDDWKEIEEYLKNDPPG